MMAHSMAGELIRVGVLMLGLWVQSALRVCNKITIEAYEITAKKKDIKESFRSIQSSFVLNGFYLILHSGHDLRAGKHTHLTYSLSLFQDKEAESWACSGGCSKKQREGWPWRRSRA